MRPIDEWNESYILNLPPGEHDWLEFKGSMSLDFDLPNVKIDNVLNVLSKQISAFANSGGGTLIYGVTDSSVIPREIDLGGISLNLRSNSTKEWLEDIIPNIVEFPLVDFNVYVITKQNESQILEGRGIFLISINDSEQAPHQARDNKYYARIGGKSKPISHRFVMDIIGRSKHPDMDPQFLFQKDKEDNDVYLEVFVFNGGRVYAGYVNGFIYILNNLRSSKNDTIKIINGLEYSSIYISNIHKDMVNYKPGTLPIPLPGGGVAGGSSGRAYYITRYDPVLPGLGFTEYISLDSDLSLDELTKYKDDKIYWHLYADNAGKKSGDIIIDEIIGK